MDKASVIGFSILLGPIPTHGRYDRYFVDQVSTTDLLQHDLGYRLRAVVDIFEYGSSGGVNAIRLRATSCERRRVHPLSGRP